MKLPFLNGEEELSRLQRLLAENGGALAVIYGRRRCGKSRLLREVLRRAVVDGVWPIREPA